MTGDARCAQTTKHKCNDIYAYHRRKADDRIESRDIEIMPSSKSIAMDCWLVSPVLNAADKETKLTPSNSRDKLRCRPGTKPEEIDPDNGHCVLDVSPAPGDRKTQCVRMRYDAPYASSVRMYAVADETHYTTNGMVYAGDVIATENAHLEGITRGGAQAGSIVAHHAQFLELPANTGESFYGCASFSAGTSASLHLL